jgi:hypothetical protein
MDNASMEKSNGRGVPLCPKRMSLDQYGSCVSADASVVRDPIECENEIISCPIPGMPGGDDYMFQHECAPSELICASGVNKITPICEEGTTFNLESKYCESEDGSVIGKTVCPVEDKADISNYHCRDVNPYETRCNLTDVKCVDPTSGEESPACPEGTDP